MHPSHEHVNAELFRKLYPEKGFVEAVNICMEPTRIAKRNRLRLEKRYRYIYLATRPASWVKRGLKYVLGRK